MVKNLLLSGVPGVGKTTLLRAVADALAGRSLRGFFTEEIRRGSQRVGFEIQTLDGRTDTLAHVEVRPPHRVGRYGVDVEALERIVDTALRPDSGAAAYLVDEIGKMECFSERFVVAMERLLERDVPVVATVALHGAGFIAAVKRRPDVELWEVTRATRDPMVPAVLRWLDTRGLVAPR
jgi:nucleoside-triphosphatase